MTYAGLQETANEWRFSGPGTLFAIYQVAYGLSEKTEIARELESPVGMTFLE